MAKKIMICFDGTNNEPSDAMQKTSPFKRNKVKDCSISNVLKLHLMFGGNLKNTLKSPQQQSFYYPGVGTYRGKLWELFNAALALPAGDITTIIRAARKDLKKTYEPGDQIFIFGFSRGAAIARRFASLLVKEPEKYFKTPPEQDPRPVRFLGVFDTVASIGSPNLSDDEMPAFDVVFQGGYTISPAIAEALHLVSIDENRKAFKPTLMNQDGRVTEVWFPGVHSDIGGGYWKDSLSDVSLEFMLRYLRRLDASIRILKSEEIDYRRLSPDDPNILIEEDDLKMNPSIQGTLHTHERSGLVAEVTLCNRVIRVLKNDRPAPNASPLVIADIARRVMDTDYDPAPLRRTAHRLIGMDGLIQKDDRGKDKIFTGTRNYF